VAVGPRVLEVIGASGPGRLSRLREWWEQEHVFGYGLIVPAVVLLLALVAFPFGMAIYFSLSDYWVGSPGAFVGLANYREILSNETFRQTVQNSFVFTGIALTLKIVLGVWLAMLLARSLPMKRVIRGIVLLPFVIPTALSTLAWLWMFDSLYSVVNWTAIRLHLMSPPGPNWLGQSTYAMAAVIVVNVWRGLPFFAITVLAGLVAIPREYYEAAEVDGAARHHHGHEEGGEDDEGPPAPPPRDGKPARRRQPGRGRRHLRAPASRRRGPRLRPAGSRPGRSPPSRWRHPPRSCSRAAGGARPRSPRAARPPGTARAR